MIISASRLEKRTHFRVCVFLIFTWALQKYIHPGNCWDCFASCGLPKNFAFPTLLWRVMEVEIQWNVADQGNPDIYCSWTIPVQQMSFGVQHSLCEVHLFLILRIPKSWGTPKSCISIGLSIIHKAIGVPPIYGSIHIDQQTVQWNLGVSHTKQLLSPMMKLRGRLHNAWTRDSRNLSGSWNRSL